MRRSAFRWMVAAESGEHRAGFQTWSRAEIWVRNRGEDPSGSEFSVNKRMNGFGRCVLCVVTAVVLLGERGTAQDRPTLTAAALPATPEIDGVVRGEGVWQDVPAATHFVQTRPTVGQAASERTEVRIGFTEEALFVAVICFDRDPAAIIVADSRRDAPLRDTDSIQLLFDPFQDGQNGFVFGTNPAGIEYDGQVINGGSGLFGGGGRQQGGSNAGLNLNWDGAWQVATSLHEAGWSAELAIPWSTLRYPKGSNQTWGLNVQRNIRRRNEIAFWAPLDQQHGIDRVSDAGTMTGVEPPTRRLVQITPYALGVVERRSDTEDTDTDFDAGFDLKLGITPSLTLDVTYNTDFAQVEVDDQQINLDRFNLFFPEKRPFFLENAGFFAVGSSGEAEIFFSRRIGLGPDGEQIPILGGARLTGKIGRTQIGLVNIQTESVGRLGDLGSVQANNYGVARVKQELAPRSSIGFMFVNRQGTGSLAPSGDHNRAYAVDGQWGIGETHTLSGFVAQTDTPDRSGDEHAFRLAYAHSSPRWRANVDFTEVGDDFNPEVGFLARDGFRKPTAFLMRILRPEKTWGLHEIRPHISYRSFWGFDGFHETEFIHIDNHLEWRNGYEFHSAINLTLEGVREPFEIAPDVVVQPDTYSHEEYAFVFFTNRGAPFSSSSRLTIGGFFGGDRVSLSQTFRFRRGEALTSELTWNHNDVDLPVGDFEVNLARLRVSYSITPRVLLQALVQYNDLTDRVASNLRFSWLRDANTGLFVVYNEIQEIGNGMELARPDRSLVVKYSHLFNLFRRK